MRVSALLDFSLENTIISIALFGFILCKDMNLKDINHCLIV